MMVIEALERRGAAFILAFAVGCRFSSVYGFCQELAIRCRPGDLLRRRRPALQDVREASWLGVLDNASALLAVTVLTR